MRQTSTIQTWQTRIAAFSAGNFRLRVFCIAALLGLSILYMHPPVIAQEPALRPLSPTERQGLKSRLDVKLLPDGATALEIEDAQLFKLSTADGKSFILVPVEFQTPSSGLGGGTVGNCALYIFSGQGASTFLWTVGNEDELRGLLQCTNLKAVSAQPMTHQMPLLILLYTAHTVHESVSQPYILSFDSVRQEYRIDEHWARKLAEQTDVTTIRQIKRLLASEP